MGIGEVGAGIGVELAIVVQRVAQQPVELDQGGPGEGAGIGRGV